MARWRKLLHAMVLLIAFALVVTGAVYGFLMLVE